MNKPTSQNVPTLLDCHRQYPKKNMSLATVLVTIHAPTVPIVSERRLPADTAIYTIKSRLELLCGVPPEAQKLSIWSSRTDDKDSRPSLILHLDDSYSSKSLEEIGVKDGMGILLEDKRSASERDQFGTEEEEKVQKYEMDDETYAQRSDTVLAFKQRMKMGRFGDAQSTSPNEPNPVPERVKVNSRCEVEGSRRGTIRFVGETEFAKGVWVGVEYDEPVGKNDGSVAGKRYFTCTPKFGGFIKPEKVNVGDFPVRSIEEELDDDEEM